LQNVAHKDNIDKLILWTCRELSNTVVRALKAVGVDTIFLREKEFERLKTISNFVPLKHSDYDYLVTLNVTADLLLRRLKKLFHLVLSEVAAPIYDALYGKAKVATVETMKYEEEIVKAISSKLVEQERNGKAVDAGCGTGRHTFPLAMNFDRVYAFDLSPKMVDEARKIKKGGDITNILFSEADFEYEAELAHEADFYDANGGKIDLIVASFGFGSFIEDTLTMLRRFFRWLRDDGYLILSFYNKESILLQVTPNWRDTSLSAHLDSESQTLKVELSPTAVFHIYCKPYSQFILRDIKGVFDVEGVHFFPTAMALLPNSLLGNPLAANLFAFVDRALAENKEFPYGHYVTIVAKKTHLDVSGFERVKALLDDSNSRYELLSHLPVRSIANVRREIGDKPNAMIKSVVFKDRPNKDNLIIIVLLAEKRVDKRLLAKELGISSGRFVYAPEKDVVKLGFPLGGLAPFGFAHGLNIELLIDKDILDSSEEWFYMGVGDNRKTLKIHSSDFKKLVQDYKTISLEQLPG
jgi:prolyl-tRNA editing enzyme YbaK/EbsC (Cys-tRNA(Pro) deacylase)/2-polyprenyl-3-methyl-5-hydroxy-6-metoxy-1,4-benzoquinol methylase